jgi:glycerol-3-phosphate dehydrogenase
MWLPIMIPLDSWWKAPYFWAGTKVYDILAGSENIESSYFLTRSKALDAFPMLKKEGLKGALVYYGESVDVPGKPLKEQTVRTTTRG